ncbi:hypothetical protein [Agromyces allii]|uniref:hypothetical protein n=1 Tax=Agromyces allii TaxID=393607 RepID=UPI0012FA9643|nr:hypothetical protein [Agromyces allii]
MDPNTARQLLRIFPDAPLTVALVERAYAGEAWARHPSRYPDPAQRQEAEAWAERLRAARSTLLAEAATVGATASTGRARLGPLAVTGIVVASVLTLTTIVGGVVGLGIIIARAAPGIAESSSRWVLDDEGDEAGPDHGERLTALETDFEFPAGLELYTDGRYDDLCSNIYERGCWQLDVIPIAACDEMRIESGYSNDEASPDPEETRVSYVDDVEPFERVPIVYGDDAYEESWIVDVTCTTDET